MISNRYNGLVPAPRGTTWPPPWLESFTPDGEDLATESAKAPEINTTALPIPQPTESPLAPSAAHIQPGLDADGVKWVEAALSEYWQVPPVRVMLSTVPAELAAKDSQARGQAPATSQKPADGTAARLF